MNLDVLTIVMTSLFGITTLTGSGTAILIAMIVSFTIVMTSSVLISLRLASLGGTPTTTTTLTIIPIMTTDQLTITSIGTIWLCRSNRNLHGAVITRARLTGSLASAVVKRFERSKRRRDCRLPG